MPQKLSKEKLAALRVFADNLPDTVLASAHEVAGDLVGSLLDHIEAVEAEIQKFQPTPETSPYELGLQAGLEVIRLARRIGYLEELLRDIEPLVAAYAGHTVQATVTHKHIYAVHEKILEVLNENAT